MKRFEVPIPGQSLTDTPRNAPYERPPEVSDPEEALQIHLARLNDPERMEDAMFFLQTGVDIVSLVEGILRSAVMTGVHSVDVSLIIAPVIHEYIKSTADILGIEYEEGFEDKEGKRLKKYARNAILARDKMKAAGVSPEETAAEVSELQKAVEESEVMDVEEMPEMEEEPRGLMARRA